MNWIKIESQSTSRKTTPLFHCQLPTPAVSYILTQELYGAVWSCMELYGAVDLRSESVSIFNSFIYSFIRIFAIPALEAMSSCLHTGVARQQCVHVQKHTHSKPSITLARKPINRFLTTCITNAGFADFNSQAVRSSRQLQ